MKKENVLISACFCGVACRYDGKENKLELSEKLKETFHLIPICPEVMGGLSIPRLPAEIVDGKIINTAGEDVSTFFRKGAEQSLQIAKEKEISFAILKARSPSCGFGFIYDGSFSKTLIEGNGWTADLLFRHGIPIFTEIDLDNLLKEDYNELTIE